MVLIDEIISGFKKYYYVDEDYNITAPICAAIANFCPGEPDIIGVIGPSGSLKTEVIRSFGESENKYIYPISSLTDKTLVSGFKESNDIVPRLQGRLLTIKDLTSILAKNEDTRAGIFADFRELTDGYIHKEYGNGVIKDYRGVHSSILFASTNAIERYYSLHSSLGQRIIFLRPLNDPAKARKWSVKNRGKEKEIRAEIHKLVIDSIDGLVNEEGLTMPHISDEIREEIGGFFDFLAVARTPIYHDYRNEIDSIPEPEFPTRIANSVSRLCEVHAMVHDRTEVNNDDVDFVARIIRDNVPMMRWRVLNAMSTDWMTTSTIKARNMSRGSIKYALDELCCLELVECRSRDETGGRSDSYRLTESTMLQLDRMKTRIRYSRDVERDREDDITTPESCSQSDKEAEESSPRSAYGMKFECEAA